MGQGVALCLPVVAWSDVTSSRSAVDSVLVGRRVGAGREKAAHGGEPGGRLWTRVGETDRLLWTVYDTGGNPRLSH